MNCQTTRRLPNVRLSLFHFSVYNDGGPEVMTSHTSQTNDILAPSKPSSLKRTQPAIPPYISNNATQPSASSSIQVPDPRHSEQYLSPAPSVPVSEHASINTDPKQSGEHDTNLTDSQRPPFQQFFTLVLDTSNSTTHHPRQIHYIFSDDDPELLTAACLDSLQNVPSPYNSAISSRQAADVESRRAQKQTKREPVRRENRVLLLDTDASGTQIVSAHSLTPNWQILNTSLVPAPTWDGDAGTEGEGATGMMLKIEGTAIEQIESERNISSVGSGAHVSEDDFHNLLTSFDEKMRILRNVLESGAIFEMEDGAPVQETTIATTGAEAEQLETGT